MDKLVAGFNEKDIKVAILKGNYLSYEVYPAIPTRTFNDLDLLINLDDASEVVEVAEQMGFIQGELDDKTHEIVPSTRKQKLYHQMTTHELQMCLKKTENPFVEVVEVDFNHNILWKGNCPYSIDTKALLDRAERLKIISSRAYVLNKEDCLLQLCCHLYKEAVVINWISDARDLKLYKFADIATYIMKYEADINWTKLLELSHEYKCEKVIYYVLYYVEYLYGDVVPGDVLKAYKFDNYNFLNEYGVENEEPSQWKIKFNERLFDLNRINEVSEETKRKNKDFWSNKSI